jgi:hypothetical protein
MESVESHDSAILRKQQPSRKSRLATIRESPDARFFSSAVECLRFSQRGLDDEKNGLILRWRIRADEPSRSLQRAGGYAVGDSRSQPAGATGD